MKGKSFWMILILLILPFMGLAQSPYGNDVVEIVVDKGGKLENAVKKANAIDAKKLRISGRGGKDVELNEKDLKFLIGMNHIEELYLNVATEGAVGYKYNALSGKAHQEDLKLSNTRFPKLKIIGVGKDAANSFYGLFDLKVQSLVVDGKHVELPEGIDFEDVYFIIEPNDYSYPDESKTLSELNEHYHWRGDPERIRNIHSIHLAGSVDWEIYENIFNYVADQIKPAIIYVHSGDITKKYLANYNSILYDEDKDPSKYDGILNIAFRYPSSNFDTLRLPDKQESVGCRFFENVSANILYLDQIKTIDKEAFYGSFIKEIHMPSTVQDIDEKAFDNSEIEIIYMDGEYAPSISSSYPPEGFKNIQFIIPKGTKKNYEIGAWKELRVLEEGASTDYAFDVKEPGTLATILTDDIRKSVVSLKLRGILFSDDIKLLESCPNLTFLDLSETFIAQSPKELKEKQETSDYLAGIFMNMGVIAQSEFEHDRISTTDNMQVQYLAKLGEMAKNQTIESDPNCQIPMLEKTSIQELILPVQLSKVNYKVFPKSLKKITLPPDLKEFSAGSPYTALSEIVLPSSVKSINITSSNVHYKNLQTLDLSACINPKIDLDAQFDKLETLKIPEAYVPESYNNGGSKPLHVSTSTPLQVYFKGRELMGRFWVSAPHNQIQIFIPKGSRAGYSSLINDGFEIIEQ